MTSTLHLLSSCSPVSQMAMTGCWICLILTLTLSFTYSNLGHSAKKLGGTRTYPHISKSAHQQAQSKKETQFSPKTNSHPHHLHHHRHHHQHQQVAHSMNQVSFVNLCITSNDFNPSQARALSQRSLGQGSGFQCRTMKDCYECIADCNLHPGTGCHCHHGACLPVTPKPLHHHSYASCNPKTSPCQCRGVIGSTDAHGEGGGLRGEKRGGVVNYYSDLSEGGKGKRKECSYVYDCLQKKKCDWDLFCRCHRGRCVSMRTTSAIGKRDCDTQKQVRIFILLITLPRSYHF